MKLLEAESGEYEGEKPDSENYYYLHNRYAIIALSLSTNTHLRMHTYGEMLIVKDAWMHVGDFICSHQVRW